MTDREQLCKEFTELTGGHWHEWVKRRGSFRNIYGEWQQSKNTGYYCSICGKRKKERYCVNYDYSNPADVLKVMMVRDDYDMFLREGLQRRYWLQIDEFIEEYILKPDAMLKAAVSFLKEHLTK